MLHAEQEFYTEDGLTSAKNLAEQSEFLLILQQEPLIQILWQVFFLNKKRNEFLFSGNRMGELGELDGLSIF